MYPSDNVTLKETELFWEGNYGTHIKLYSRFEIETLLFDYDVCSLYLHYPRLVEKVFGVGEAHIYVRKLINELDDFESVSILDTLEMAVLNFFINIKEGSLCSPVS